MGFASARRGASGVDEAVLAELRAIRAEIHDLAERVAAAATREDLHGYVTQTAWEAHQREHEQAQQGVRFWLPYALSVGTFIFWLISAVGVHLVWK